MPRAAHVRMQSDALEMLAKIVDKSDLVSSDSTDSSLKSFSFVKSATIDERTD